MSPRIWVVIFKNCIKYNMNKASRVKVPAVG